MINRHSGGLTVAFHIQMRQGAEPPGGHAEKSPLGRFEGVITSHQAPRLASAVIPPSVCWMQINQQVAIGADEPMARGVNRLNAAEMFTFVVQL